MGVTLRVVEVVVAETGPLPVRRPNQCERIVERRIEVPGPVRQEIARVQREGISTEELQRVKAQVVAAQVYQRDSMFYQAMLIAQMESAGLSWRDDKIMLERFNAVTAEQVQAVAQKYLQDDGLTIATLDPQPMEAKHAVKKMTGGRHAH